MLTHDFILTPEIPETILYSMFQHKDMVEIDDEFILEHFACFRAVEMFWEKKGVLRNGLAYHGITIITPDMALQLRDELSRLPRGDNTTKMLKLLNAAIKSNQYIIHFGV